MNGEKSINFTEQNCSKDNNRLAGQKKNAHLLWNQKINYGFHNPTTGRYPQQAESNLPPHIQLNI
jgi:hypothetical protein